MRLLLTTFVLSFGLLFAACGTSGETESTETSQLMPAVAAESASLDLKEIDPEGFTAVIREGSIARYLIKEQLAKFDLPNDAIGETTDIAGSIAFDSKGAINSDHSNVRIGLSSLKSDEARRDRYVRMNTLRTDQFPYARIKVVKLEGFPWPLPSAGTFTFDMETETTIHGQTKPLNWSVDGRVDDGIFQGSARTSFSFEMFGIEKPQVYFVLSVEDNIRLEMDFRVSVLPNG